MELILTPEQDAFVRQAITTGRLHRVEDAVQEALALWEKQERNRIEILAALDESEDDLQAGRYVDYSDDSLPELERELKQEARALRNGRP